MQIPEPPTRIYRPHPTVPGEIPEPDNAPVRIYPPQGSPCGQTRSDASSES